MDRSDHEKSPEQDGMQHIRASARDHGLNSRGDVNVIRLWGAPVAAAGSCGAGASRKIPVALPATPLVPLEPADLTEPAKT
jgi:hypothetical protein